MKPGFRAAMTFLHNWTGIVIGWLLFAITLSGTLSVFRPEISVWMHPELTRHVPPRQATAAALEWLSRNAAGSPAWYLNVADTRVPYTWAVWSDKDTYFQRAMDPVTGSPAPLRDTLGGEFFYRFHFELQFPYPWGRLLAALAAMSLLLALLTGIVAHRRIFTDLFTFRPGKGQRSWLDAHNLMGVAALPFHLMIAFTGAVALGETLLPWSTQAAGDPTQLATELNPGLAGRPLAGKPGKLVSADTILQTASEHFGRTGLAQIFVFNPTDQAATIALLSGTTDTIGINSHILTLDGTTGQILSDHLEHRPAVTTFNVLYGLHVARFAPIFTRWLYFLSGLLLTATIATGLHLWTVKRRRRTSRGVPSPTLVEHLNVGLIAGLPTAFAAYFLANRILPFTLADRASREVDTVFSVWAVLLVFCLFRSPRHSWRDMLGLAALACGAVGVVSFPLTTDIQRATAAVAFSAACGFAYAARRAHCANTIPC